MITFANEVDPAVTCSIGTGNASASVAATSNAAAGPARCAAPPQSARPRTAAAAVQTGRTMGAVGEASTPRTTANRRRSATEGLSPTTSSTLESIAQKG